ncbi:hypothetical protein Tco_1140850 [Tanacetum coccineum]
MKDGKKTKPNLFWCGKNHEDDDMCRRCGGLESDFVWKQEANKVHLPNASGSYKDFHLFHLHMRSPWVLREWLPCVASTSKNALYSIAYNNEASTPATQNSIDGQFSNTQTQQRNVSPPIKQTSAGAGRDRLSFDYPRPHQLLLENVVMRKAAVEEQTLSHREDRVITRSHTQGAASPVVVSDDQSTSDYSPRSSEVLSAEETLGHRDDRVKTRSQTQELRSNEENSPMSTGHHSQPQEKQHLVASLGEYSSSTDVEWPSLTTTTVAENCHPQRQLYAQRHSPVKADEASDHRKTNGPYQHQPKQWSRVHSLMLRQHMGATLSKPTAISYPNGKGIHSNTRIRVECEDMEARSPIKLIVDALLQHFLLFAGRRIQTA